jgi:hypothetical protein
MDDATVIWFVSINQNCRYCLSYILISALNIKLAWKISNERKYECCLLQIRFIGDIYFTVFKFLLDADNDSLQQLR